MSDYRGKAASIYKRELTRAKRELPIIFITGHGDIPMSVQAMKKGAIEFLTKPFRDQDLLDAIQVGLLRHRAWRENEEVLADLRERFASLSPREREIVIQVARGRLSKQIAHDRPSSGSERAFIFCIALLRCTFTVLEPVRCSLLGSWRVAR